MTFLVGVRYHREGYGLDFMTRQFDEYVADESVHFSHNNGDIIPTPGFEKHNELMLKEADVVWTAESWFGITRNMLKPGARMACSIMPELFSGDDADLLHLPTVWRAGEIENDGLRVRRLAVMDWPCPNPPETFHVKQQDTFLHITRPAMEDREGSNILQQALELVNSYVTVNVIGVKTPEDFEAWQINNPRVEVRHYSRFDTWPSLIEATGALTLVQPRRYGGQSLVQLDAMSQGMLFIGADREPENTIWNADLLTQWSAGRNVRMKGGRIRLENAYPDAIADRIDFVASNDMGDRERSARETSVVRSWDVNKQALRNLIENA